LENSQENENPPERTPPLFSDVMNNMRTGTSKNSTSQPPPGTSRP
jgi:hypothetical protein